jgi:hypothetical protein
MDAGRVTAGSGIWGWSGSLVLYSSPPPGRETRGHAAGGRLAGISGWWVGMEIEEKGADEWVPPEGSCYRVEI